MWGEKSFDICMFKQCHFIIEKYNWDAYKYKTI